MERGRILSLTEASDFFVNLGRPELDEFVEKAADSNIPLDFLSADLDDVERFGWRSRSTERVARLLEPDMFTTDPEALYALTWMRAISSAKLLASIRETEQDGLVALAEHWTASYYGMALFYGRETLIEGKGWRLKSKVTFQQQEEIQQKLEDFFKVEREQ
jgi:hypothetical protein